MYCEKCGASIEDGTEFCPECGARQKGNKATEYQDNYSADNSQPTQQVTKKRNGVRNLFIVLSIIELIALVACVVLFVIPGMPLLKEKQFFEDAKIAAEDGAYEEAVELYEKLLKQNPGDVNAAMALVELQMEEEEFEDAQKSFEDLLDVWKEDYVEFYECIEMMSAEELVDYFDMENEWSSTESGGFFVNPFEETKIAKDRQAIDVVAAAVAIAWCDPYIGGNKIITEYPVVHTEKEFREATVTTEPVDFMTSIYSMVGYTAIYFESDEYKNVDSLKVDINTTTGKVTVSCVGKSGEVYSITK